MAHMEPIAIVGTACRFAGSSSSPSKLWELLQNPKDVASEPPADRFNIDAFYDPEGSNPMATNARQGYFLSDKVKAFDAPFFNISATEALALDPQQRMLLEVVYESLETAGLRLDALRGSSTGVYCGVMNSDWEGIFSVSCAAPQYGSVGVARNNLANRISYFFDWQGPSMSIDTACSASMVALYEAVSALTRRDCNLAAALGANLMLSPQMFIAASNLQMLSPTSRSRMWDAQADGYARGEGVASVLLKRLSDAVADGDPIECVIRAVGVNHDGRSMGFTMPSSDAQVQLIRSTYAKAGLDPRSAEDRPQYVEAHGTGTLAGDPQEASALHQAFFSSSDEDTVLHVGSIKTVVGHAEGTAGLAGLIKASQCIQHGIIPPNLLFNRLNPALEPYARQLRVPVDVVPWPPLSPGVTRRVSVNSFGFGGTNAHVILESYEPAEGLIKVNCNQNAVLPFVFSAESDFSLGAVLEQYSKYLSRNPDVDVHDLAWTLLERRSALMHRVAFWAPDIAHLKRSIQDELAVRKGGAPSTLICRPHGKTRKHILGVFTGQGAQWAQMGLELINTSNTARGWLDELQQSLDALPEPYRPGFSLFQELAADSATSRLSEALLSQTLCTAMQVIWLKMLWALNIHFDAVVGHSSGEIAAGFAAGFLTAEDAIRIAYLRGVFCSAPGSSGEGAMLAAGLSMDEATALCEDVSSSEGRINVAASNSPESVTVSGDRDAILRAEQLLKDRGIFVRLLRVSTAYHSHHMQACSQPYQDALRGCNIQIQTPMSTTTWYSSVYAGRPMEEGSVTETLGTGEYWAENLVSPVLFSQALSAAMSATNPSLIVEVGPHPALKGPALQTLSGITPAEIPYIGVSVRNNSAIESMATAIGAFWAHLGPQAINPRGYLALFQPNTKPSVVRGLPLYPFDHRQEHGYQTRKANGWLYRRNTPHPLLGSLSEDLGEGELRWNHYLSPRRIRWLDGHRVQGQIVVPATAYIVMALEAALALAVVKEKSLHLIRIDDLIIGQAISFQDERDEVETLFHLPPMLENRDDNTAVGRFRCQMAASGGHIKTCAEGILTVTWGSPQDDVLPCPVFPSPAGLADVTDMEEYYASLRTLGYEYTGVFQGIHSLSRKMGIATGQVYNPALTGFLIHPAVLDTGLQGLLAAAGEGQLTTLHVPTRIDTVSVNPAVCSIDSLSFEAAVTRTGADGIVGDVELYTAANGPGAVFFEGVHVSSLVPPSAADDPSVFWVQHWTPLVLDVNRSESRLSPEWMTVLEGYERRAFLALKDILQEVTPELRATFDWHRESVVSWIEHIMEETRMGQRASCKPEWLGQNLENLGHIWGRPDASIEDRMMYRVYQNLLPFLRGEAKMLDALRQDELLTQFYRDEHELRDVNRRLGQLVGDLAVRFPRMKLLEVGAGTGSATREVLKHVSRAYHSYTFTDISVGFFEDMLETLPEHADRLIFQKLDVGQDPLEQGFTENAYDVIIAANVLHATPALHETLRNVRRLLKPGGYLIALEITNIDAIRIGYLMCAFDGWWLGREDGRPWGPVVSASQWDSLLRETGFGGIDSITDRAADELTMYSVFAAQAVDDQITRIREPLTPLPPQPPFCRGVIIGGSPNLVTGVRAIIHPFFSDVEHVSAIENLTEGAPAVVLMVADLSDTPCFQILTESRLAGLKALVKMAEKTLWVTMGSEAENPFLCLSKGFLTSMNYEHPNVFQYLNIIDPADVQPVVLSEHLLRLAHTTQNNDFTLTSCVHSTELELRLYPGGILKFPRINASNVLNRRYAAARRPVTSPVTDMQESVVVLGQGPDGKLQLLLGEERLLGDRTGVTINVRYSTNRAVRINGAGYLVLVLGQDKVTKTRLVALAGQSASVISTSCYWEIPADISEEQEAAYLYATATALLAASLIQSNGTTILVHGADAILRHAIAIEAASRVVQPIFTTTSPSAASSTGFGKSILVHQNESRRQLAHLLPRYFTAAVNFDSNDHRLFDRMMAIGHQSGVTQEHLLTTLTAVLPRPSASSLPAHPQAVIDALRKAALTAYQLTVQSTAPGHIATSIADIQSCSQELAVADWTPPCGSVPVHLQPASQLVRLSAQKTYLLVGMTGALGQSITQWLIARGARNIVLTSRNPSVDPAWILEMQSTTGARVLVTSMDVTSRASILAVAHALKAGWPPLGGVVNGAMVLWDQLFVDAPLSVLTGQLAPKVQGSLLLDEIFGQEPGLDFFILFGSAIATIGNLGQSAYTAASNFMVALAARRRARGLVASVLQPAQVAGTMGYLRDKDDSFWARMFDMIGRHLVSEPDLHELFAHAILSGRGPPSDVGFGPGEGECVIGGLSVQDPAVYPNILWFRTPKVWPFIHYHHEGTGPSSAATGSVPLVEQLKCATSLAQVGEVVEAGVAAKLHHRLHLPGEVGSGNVTGDTRLTELGVDSLIAVDLRRWFAQELEVDIPVLQMLSGCSVKELAAAATALLQPKFYPGVVGDSDVGSEKDGSSDSRGDTSSSSYQVITPEESD
ncbi:hypothetical protein ATERTT37_000531 [Aspergillus terreus]